MKFLQKLGKALMLPVAVLPICGILMGIGYYLCPATMQGGDIEGVRNLIGLFLVKAGGALIDNMAILFVIGVGVGMSDKNDGTGGIAALASWLMMALLPQSCHLSLTALQRHLHSTRFKTHLSVSWPVLLVLCVTTDLRIQSFLTGCHSSVASVA